MYLNRSSSIASSLAISLLGDSVGEDASVVAGCEPHEGNEIGVLLTHELKNPVNRIDTDREI